MKRNPQKLVIVLSTAAIFLILVLFYLSPRNVRPTESLVAWGWQGNMPDRECILQVINPSNQKFGLVHAKDENCNYQVMNVQGQSHLVGEQKDPKAIVLYSITSTGDLAIEKTIPVEGVSVISDSLHPQFGDDGYIYFAGILNSATGIMQERVQLLRLDSQTGEINSFAAYEEGMIDSPQLSPDGSFLIYSIYPGSKTWSYQQSSGASYYQILDMETNITVDLASQVNHLGANPVFSHCNLQWSPTGRFIAFNLGCESESPGYIVIYDVEDNEVVTVIKPVEDALTFHASMIGWLSNDEIIYGQNVSKEGYESRHFYRYFIYSLSTDMSEELEYLPLTNSEGLGLTVRDINWTPDGKWLAAAVNGWSEAVAPLLIADMDSEKVSNIALNTINERPLWSPSGDWIAYISFEDPGAWNEGRNTVKITNRAGEEFLDTDISNITAALNYAWMQP